MGNSQENSPGKAGLKVFHKGLILVATPLLIEVFLISSLAYLLLESDKESLRESKYRRCAALGARLMSLANDAVIAAFATVQEPKLFTRVYDADRAKIELKKRQLMEAASGDRLSLKAATQLTDSLDDLAPLLDKVTGSFRHGERIIEVAPVIKEIQDEFNSKRDINMERMATVTRLQQKIAEDSSKRSARLQDLQFKILSIGFLANLAAGILLLVFYRRSIYQRLQIVMNNTTRLADGEALAPALSGADEIAQLDQAFHSMDRELKAAAQRERLLFENANDVICVLSRDLKFLKINPSCESFWGYKPDELLNKALPALIAEQKQKKSAESQFARAERKHESVNLEISMQRRDGETSETLWTTYYSPSEEKLYCVVHDISEQKRLEKEKAEFLSTMSYDLRLPLNKISEDLGKLLGPLKEELSEKAVKRLDTVKTNIGRLVSMVDELLQLTQWHETGPALRQDCSLKELLTRATQDLEGIAQKANIRFEIICADEMVYADPNKIMQVLVNLGSNAIKFSPAASSIRFEASNQNQIVEVRVIDSGRGVPDEHKEAIFEKFKQVDAADGKRKSGTGLGLPICKEIVEENGGRIGVESESGKGSKFWFRLPANESIFRRIMDRRQKEKELQTQELSIKMAALKAPLQGKPVKGSSGSKLSLMRKGMILIGVPILFELIFVCGLSSVLLQSEKNRMEEFHERQIDSVAFDLLNAYFSLSLTVVKGHSYETWLVYDNICQEILNCGEKLKKLTKHDQSLSRYYKAADKIQAKAVARIIKGREIVAQGFSKKRSDQARIDRYEMWALAAAISKRIGILTDETEKKEFLNPVKQQELRKQQGLLLFFGLAGNVLASLFMAVFFSKDLRSRLAALADNASRLAKDLELNPVLPGNDEIARLDEAFHRSAQKLAESRKKERAVFDNAKDLFCVLSASGNFLSSNPAAQEILLYSRDELAEKTLFDLLSDNNAQSIRSALKEDLSKGKTLETQVLRSDGSCVELLLSISRPEDQENIYCVAHDISERKELERLKQEFLSVVSHDLRSPLTSMTGSATLIEEGASGAVGEAAGPLIHDIIVQGGSLIDLINDLLDLEKFEAGKMQLIKTESELSDILNKAKAEVRKAYPDLDMQIDETLPSLKLKIDPERFQQAISYILLFLSSAKSNESRITFESKTEEDRLFLYFAENQQELSQAALKNIFKRLPGGNTERLRRPHLSSLSMPLVEKIIEAHNGSIEATGAPTKGIVFRISLSYSK
ncbi:MAG: PAS domain S-box protein [Candidatus Obscuribacterales bacterium]|nr:PAS domain S-box protein [Candidatus Obscuribacterales bacterium]